MIFLPSRQTVPPWVALSDLDVRRFVRAVEAADGQQLELPVRKLYHEFVTGCKADGIWNAIKACCIMAGARTLSGALIPLVGPAPTNFNFVSGDYNRRTGLVGNGSTKYLDSNRLSTSDPQNNCHVSIYQTQQNTVVRFLLGARTISPLNTTQINNTGAGQWAIQIRNNNPNQFTGSTSGAQFAGGSRNNSSNETRRNNNVNTVFDNSSLVPAELNYFIFACNQDGTPTGLADTARLSFYSIGESLDLALLDARVTALMNGLAAVLP